MSDNPTHFDPNVFSQLACPVCFGQLRFAAFNRQIECAACQRFYPLIDGIPILIPERSTMQDTQ